jgi:hypothetical protein
VCGPEVSVTAENPLGPVALATRHPSIHKSYHYIRRPAAAAQSVELACGLKAMELVFSYFRTEANFSISKIKLLFTANIVRSSLIISTLKMEVTRSYET